MLYNLFSPLAETHIIFNLFRYLTFRSAGAIITSMLVGFLIAPYIIAYLKKLQKEGQPIRTDGPQSHLVTKKGTPTMGGIIIIISTLISTILWSNILNPFIWLTLFVFIAFAALGFVDDYNKLRFKNTKGVPGKIKMLVQFSVCIISYIWLSHYMPSDWTDKIAIPFFKIIKIDLGLLYFFFISVVVVGSSNAVNLTDGLDGLAIVPVIISTACFALICYLTGNLVFAKYLQIPYIPGSGELVVFCASLIGASLVFLWYNASPAEIFMGDTGSLALGGAIGIMSVITKSELLLAIIGGVFVLEALSVIIQVLYFKYSGGKRIFLMAPLHHHFEQKGWPETKVVIRFWILALIFALIGLTTLKLR